MNRTPFDLATVKRMIATEKRETEAMVRLEATVLERDRLREHAKVLARHLSIRVQLSDPADVEGASEALAKFAAEFPELKP